MKHKWIEPVAAVSKAIPDDAKLAVLSQTGSRAYGTNRPDSDYDYKGVYVTPLESWAGLKEPQQTIDIVDPDITMYELRHFCKLAANANPTILEILWSHKRQTTPLGSLLIENRSLFLSKRVRQTYGGYAMEQLKKAKNGTGGARAANHLKRTKFKLHTIRLVDAGITALGTGQVPVKVADPEWLWSMAEKPIEYIEGYVQARMLRMDMVLAHSDLPDVPDYEAINELMLKIRREV